MEQKKYINAEIEPKIAYELSSAEFAVLMQNLRLFGDIAKVAIISSNDRKSGKRPRVQPAKEAVELLHEVLGDENADNANISLSELDVLKVERAEINWAVNHSAKSDLYKKHGNVVLGLASMASAMNELREPLISGSPLLVDAEGLREMFSQFHQEGVERLSAQV